MYERYHKARREAKQMMLNEFCLNTGYSRKYAIRLLNGAPPGKQPERRLRERRPRYRPQMLSVLAAIWEAAGYPWSVRLQALLPNWMPWIRKRHRMAPAMEKQLLGISARQIDRRFAGEKERAQTACLRTHQAGLAVEASHPGEDRLLGRDFAGVQRDRPGGALWKLGRRRACPYSEPDRHP